MIAVRLILLVSVIGLAARCAMTQTDVPMTAFGVIDLVIVDQDGLPLSWVAVFSDHGAYVAEQGGVRLTVSGPVYLSAYRPGFAASPRALFYPGQREIVLYRMGRVN